MTPGYFNSIKVKKSLS